MGKRRLLLALSATGIAILVGGLVFEVFLRACLFGDGALAERFGGRFRDPDLYTHASHEDDWKLRVLFGQGLEEHPNRNKPHKHSDPTVGWRARGIAAGSYAHSAATRLDGRRPVLLYGDSFANCVSPPAQCFEGFLERSDLGDRYALINYGVAGYGLGQMLLLLERSLDAYLDLDPIVVVSVLVEDDLVRSMTGIRSWPKPRFRLEDGELVLDLPDTADPIEYLQRHPPGITSYAWRYMVFGTGVFASLRDEEAWIESQRALNRRLIEEMRRRLHERGLDAFFVLFNGKPSCESSRLFGWQEPFLHRTLDELGIPFVSTRADLLEDSRRTGRDLQDYFYPQAVPERGHYTALGNEVSFRAMRAGLRGRFETPGEVLVLDAPR